MSVPTGKSGRSVRHTLALKILDSMIRWTHRSPRFRRRIVDLLGRLVARSYGTAPDPPDLLARKRWFGRSLRLALDRLIEERPRAARAILRFAATWATDVVRRSEVLHRDSTSPAPSTVVVELTDRCNLACPGCYAKSASRGSDLSFDLLCDIVREVRTMGLSLVTLSGGEPFLREREDRSVTRLAAEFPELGFMVYTNGLLIDEAVAGRLGRAGNVFPAISVEGHEPETDARRGAGCYRKGLAVRRLLAEHEVLFGFSATVTAANADLICDEAFIDRRIEAGDLFGWFFLFQPIGRSPRPDLMVSAEQRARLREHVYRWRDQGKPLFLGDFWNDGPLVGGCMAGGRFYFHIYANGDISPCVFAPVTCGNIKDIISGRSPYGSLKEFVLRHPFFVAYRRMQKAITDHRAPCPLIDHPWMFRAMCADHSCRPAGNMPSDYLEGPIAAAIDEGARGWAALLPHGPAFPVSLDPARADRDLPSPQSSLTKGTAVFHRPVDEGAAGGA